MLQQIKSTLKESEKQMRSQAYWYQNNIQQKLAALHNELSYNIYLYSELKKHNENREYGP
jgi:hypothetical protein